MSRKILSVALALILAVGFASFVTRADVTGNFNASVTVEPIACGALPFVSFPGSENTTFNCEKTMTKTDFVTEMNINWTISGLTLGFHAHAGFTGLEDVITNLQATLGALNITDQFVFAMPFGSDTLLIHNTAGTQTHSQTVYTLIPTNSDGSSSLLFVKKRVSASISIAGITLTNLAILEDTSFPSPSAAQPAIYLAASQTFNFGDTITIEGQTVSGITVRNITGIGMDPQGYNIIKHHTFPGVVCAEAGAAGVPLTFAVEKIQVEGIPVGPVNVNEYLEFRFNPDACTGLAASPFSSMTSLSFNTALGAVSATLTSTNITEQLFSGVSLTLSSGGLTIVQNFNSTLTPTTTSVTLATTLNPDSNPASLTLTANAARGTGLTSLSADLSVQRSGVTFETVTTLSGSGTVTLSGLEFIVTATAGAVNLTADVTAVPAWEGVFGAGINF